MVVRWSEEVEVLDLARKGVVLDVLREVTLNIPNAFPFLKE